MREYAVTYLVVAGRAMETVKADFFETLTTNSGVSAVFYIIDKEREWLIAPRRKVALFNHIISIVERETE